MAAVNASTERALATTMNADLSSPGGVVPSVTRTRGAGTFSWRPIETTKPSDRSVEISSLQEAGCATSIRTAGKGLGKANEWHASELFNSTLFNAAAHNVPILL